MSHCACVQLIPPLAYFIGSCTQRDIGSSFGSVATGKKPENRIEIGPGAMKSD